MLQAEDALALAIDFQDRMMPVIDGNEELTKKAVTFLKGCRILGVPVLATQQYTKGLGETVAPVKEAIGEFEHIEKNTFSCYKSEEFRRKLEQSGRKNIIVTGVEAHICVQQTALDLLDHGYCVYVLVDCISSRFSTDRKFAMKRMDRAGAIFTTMESILFELLGSADHPRRKEITSLVK